MLLSAESEMVRLISRKLFSQNSNLYDHDTSTLQTDKLPWQYRAALVRYRLRAVKTLPGGREWMQKV